MPIWLLVGVGAVFWILFKGTAKVDPGVERPEEPRRLPPPSAPAAPDYLPVDDEMDEGVEREEGEPELMGAYSVSPPVNPFRPAHQHPNFRGSYDDIGLDPDVTLDEDYDEDGDEEEESEA